MTLPPGTFIVGSKLMAVCAQCGKIVSLNKPFLGSMHICSLPPDTPKKT